MTAMVANNIDVTMDLVMSLPCLRQFLLDQIQPPASLAGTQRLRLKEPAVGVFQRCHSLAFPLAWAR